MRILEIMNDFRTLQMHISSLVSRSEATPPDQQSFYLDGYVVLRQSAAESQAILATHYNPGNLGIQAGNVPETEVQKATLQRYVEAQAFAQRKDGPMLTWSRIILDSSTRRFQAHKIYLRASSGIRWIQMRTRILRGERPSQKHANALRAADLRLREVSCDTADHDRHFPKFDDIAMWPTNPRLAMIGRICAEWTTPFLTMDMLLGIKSDYRRPRCQRPAQRRPEEGLLDRRGPDFGENAGVDQNAEMMEVGGVATRERRENGVAIELTPKLTLGWPLQIKIVPINHDCECDQRGMGCHHDDEDERGQGFSCGQGRVGHCHLKRKDELYFGQGKAKHNLVFWCSWEYLVALA